MSQNIQRQQIDASIDDCQLHRPERNHYFHGKLMAARDMVAEQRYHRALTTRHHRYVTGFGVVTGLGASIRRDEDDLQVTLEAGMAIDCCGRPIIVPSETTIRVPEDEVPTANEYALWITYEECVTESVPVPGRETTDKRDCAYNRVIESFSIDVTSVSKAEDGLKPVPGVTFPDPVTEETFDEGSITVTRARDTLRKARVMKEAIKFHADIESARAITPMTDDDEDRTPFLASIAGSWDEMGPEDMPIGCGDHHAHDVLLGTFSEPGSDGTALDTQLRPQVYTNDMLYSGLAHHTADFGNPHDVTAGQVGALKSVNGVEHAGGDVDFRSSDIAFDTVIEENDRAVEFAVPELETINDRIDDHLDDDENPHDVTAVQTGAIESIRGVVTTNANIEFTSEEIAFEHETPGNEDPVIEFAIPSLPELRSEVDEHLSDTSNPHDVTAEQTGSIGRIHGIPNPGGNVAFTSEDIAFDRLNGDEPAIEFAIPRLAEVTEELTTHLNDTDNPHNVEVEDGGGLERVNGVEHGDGNIEFVSLTEQAKFVTDKRRVDDHQVGLDITGFDDIVDRLDEMSEELHRLSGALEERDSYLVERSIRAMAKEYESAERRYRVQLEQPVSQRAVDFLADVVGTGEEIEPEQYVHFLDGTLGDQAQFYDILTDMEVVSEDQLQTSRLALDVLDDHIQTWEGKGLFPIAKAQIRVAELLGSYQGQSRHT